jgi:hypothetical protein
MTTVLLDGRKLPHGDWEGDDFTPGAGGKMVTCTDTSAGRALCYATNGRKDLDGRQIRAAVHPHDTNGINLRQAKQAIEALTNTTIVIPSNWGWTEVSVHLRHRPYVGLIAQLWYAEIPRKYRKQAGPGLFGHAVWLSHYSVTSNRSVRLWDALDPNEDRHGEWVPVTYVRAAMEELARREGTGPGHLFCGYIPLQPL